MRQVFRFHVSPQVVVGSRIASWMQTSYFAAVSANLFLISASRQIPHPHSGPAQFGHTLDRRRNSARRPVALRDLNKSSNV